MTRLALHFSCETLVICLQIQLIHETVEDDTAGNYMSAVKRYCYVEDDTAGNYTSAVKLDCYVYRYS